MVDWNDRGRIAEDITQAAGMTPLLRLGRVAKVLRNCAPSSSL